MNDERNNEPEENQKPAPSIVAERVDQGIPESAAVEPTQAAAENSDEANAPAGDTPASPVAPVMPRLSELRVDPTKPIGGKRLLVSIPVGKPEGIWWFRTRPGDEFRAAMLMVEMRQAGTTETYLAVPSVAGILGNLARLIELRVCITHQGHVFLWPVKQRTARENAWTESANKAAALAEDHWIRLESSDGHYDVIRAMVPIAEPIWPKKSLEELIGIAFRSEHIIRDEHHPVVGYLIRGEV